MATTARWVEAARRILETSGRPLSVRKILAIGQRDGAFRGQEPDVGALREALAAGGVPEVRRGVFALREEAERAPAEEPVEADEEPAADDDADFDLDFGD